jgi:AcrR family transcriptional regulator
MPAKKSRTPRRTDPLSKDLLVQTAVHILDTDGEDALTFRLISARLTTGPGAIYHHVANKNELLKAATTLVIGGTVTVAGATADPLEAIRQVALAVFDAIDEHPWVGTQLTAEPWQFAIIEVFEFFGVCLQNFGLPRHARFDSVSALVSFILGLAGQHAAAARLLPGDTERAAFLQAMAEEWTHLDPATFPFIHDIAKDLDTHDDRAQFLAGIDLILAGIRASW